MSFGSESIRFHVLPVYRRMAEHEMFSKRGELEEFLQRQSTVCVLETKWRPAKKSGIGTTSSGSISFDKQREKEEIF